MDAIIAEVCQQGHERLASHMRRADVSFTNANGSFDHELKFFEDRMHGGAAPLAEGFPAVCLFVNDIAGARVLAKLADRDRPGCSLRRPSLRRLQQPRSPGSRASRRPVTARRRSSTWS